MDERIRLGRMNELISPMMSSDVIDSEAKTIGVDQLRLPGVKIGSIPALTTTAQTIYYMMEGRMIDWTLQNNSQNIVYILQYENQPVIEALRLIGGANANAKDWTGDLIVIASAAATDLRYSYEIHGSPWAGITKGGGP